MKICITSVDRDLDSNIDPRFGRCNSLIIYDVETNKFKAFENYWKEASGGADIQVAQFMIQKGVKKSFYRKSWSKCRTGFKKSCH